MQSASSRIWTLVTVSISYDDNHYITGTSNQMAYRYIRTLMGGVGALSLCRDAFGIFYSTSQQGYFHIDFTSAPYILRQTRLSLQNEQCCIAM